MYFVYILWSEKLSRFYTGTTNNLTKRLEKHNNGTYRESFSVKGVSRQFYFSINCNTSEQAYAIEKHIKRMKSSDYIRNLKRYPEMVENLISQYSG